MKKDIFYEAFHDKTDKVEFFQSAHDDTFVHFHRCIELIYVTDGAIDCEVGEEKFRAKKDELIFARKCAPHALAAAPDFVNYVLIIGQRYSDDFLGIFQTETLPAHLDDAEFNRSLLPHFEALNHLRDTDSELVKKGYINIIIAAFWRITSVFPSLPRRRWASFWAR